MRTPVSWGWWVSDFFDWLNRWAGNFRCSDDHLSNSKSDNLKRLGTTTSMVRVFMSEHRLRKCCWSRWSFVVKLFLKWLIITKIHPESTIRWRLNWIWTLRMRDEGCQSFRSECLIEWGQTMRLILCNEVWKVTGVQWWFRRSRTLRLWCWIWGWRWMICRRVFTDVKKILTTFSFCSFILFFHSFFHSFNSCCSFVHVVLSFLLFFRFCCSFVHVVLSFRLFFHSLCSFIHSVLSFILFFLSRILCSSSLLF